MAVPLTLKVFKGDSLVASREYDRDIIKIGRLSSAHLCLDDDKVSRIHSVIEVAPDGRLSIIDMGSVEGTYVNGKRVNKGSIAFGDEIKLGNTTIRVENGPANDVAANLATAASSIAPEAVLAVSDGPDDAARATAVATLAQAAQVTAPALVQAPVVEPIELRRVPVAGPSEAVTQPPRSVPRVRPGRRSGKGPLGLELRFLWGDQIVAEHLLPPQKKNGGFTIGTAAGVDFVCGDSTLGTEKYEVVSWDASGFLLHFNAQMKGSLERRGIRADLVQLVETHLAQHDGEGYVLTLEPDDVASLDLGGVTLDLCFQQMPKPVLVPLTESLDWTALNIFLLVFFLFGLFVVTALNRAAAGDEYLDELSGNNAVLTKLLIKPPESQKNPFLEQLARTKEKAAEAPAAHKDAEGKMGKRDAPNRNARAAPKAIDPSSKDQARLIAQRIFGGKGNAGIATLFGRAGLGGSLQAAMGNLTGATVGDAGGVLGMGLRGGGGGGGGTGNTIGIGAVGTKGVAGGKGEYGNGIGMGKKATTDIGITSSDPEITGSIDRELIRRVVHSHRDQLRYCYDLQLTRNPKLSGKVSVKWIITEQGTVATTNVVQTTTGNPELDACVAGRVKTWIFPKPKGGGVAIVTYPFIFKQAGE